PHCSMDASAPSTLPLTRLRDVRPLSSVVARLVRGFGSSRLLLLHSDIFRAIELRARSVMLFRSFQNVVMWRRLVLVIVWFAIILPHRIILELVPHQNASQIRVAIEPNPVEIEDFPLLKFSAPING